MGEVSIAGLARRGVLLFSDGYRTKRSELGLSGYRILRVADIEDGRVTAKGDDFVRSEFLPQIGLKLSRPGDVLLTTKGTVGRVARYPADADEVVYSPQLCFFRVLDSDVVDAQFLSYWFRSTAFIEQASYLASSTDMAAYINLRDVASLVVQLPALAEQRAVVAVLGALDEKIAANGRVVAAADRLRSDSIAAAAIQSGGALRLSDLARFVNGRAFTKDATGVGRVVVRIAELNSGLSGSTVYNDIDVADDHVARPGDLLFAWSGSLTVARWYRDEAIVNQHIFKVIPNAGYREWLVDHALRSKLTEFQGVAADKATTMGHIQRRHLDEEVRVPEIRLVARLDDSMTALWHTALVVEMENERLAATRDELLPLLMSRKLRVKDAEKVVEDVL